jgi:hypothetical protein
VDPAGWFAEQIGACEPDLLRRMVKTMAKALMRPRRWPARGDRQRQAGGTPDDDQAASTFIQWSSWRIQAVRAGAAP